MSAAHFLGKPTARLAYWKGGERRKWEGALEGSVVKGGKG